MTKLLVAALSVALAAAWVTADAIPYLDSLPPAEVFVQGTELVFELPPTDLPAGLTHEMMHGGMAMDGADGGHGAMTHGDMAMEGHGRQTGPGWPDVSRVTIPVSGAMYGFRVQLIDSAGTVLPEGLLHHLNLIDPFHRELFLPISRRVIAAGKETGAQRLPWLLFGLPFHEGEQLVLSAMLHNPTTTSYHGVRTRLVIQYTRSPRPWPIWDIYPWQLDVLFPVGDKAFDLPPGRSSKSYEAKPAIAGRIVALGGHVHEHARRLSLTDVTTGTMLWEAAPDTDARGTVTGVPIARFYRWNRVGVAIDTSHVYRVTVAYDNPTGETLPQGGMGVIGGLFVPADASRWPRADVADTLYLADLRHYLRRTDEAPMAQMTHQHGH